MIVYKYMTNEGFKRFCQNPALKFSKISDFNDPFDAQFMGIDNFYKKLLYKSYVKKYLSMPCANFEDDFYRIVNEFNQEIDVLWKKLIDNYRVSCFTNYNKNMLMWSHYAENHKGVCIGIDLSSYKGLELERVSYKKPIIYPFFKKYFYIDGSPKRFTVNNKESFNKYSDKELKKYLWVKNSFWSYENEYRIILDKENISEDGLYKLNKSNVKEVIYGVNNTYFKSCYIPPFNEANFYKANKLMGKLKLDLLY